MARPNSGEAAFAAQYTGRRALTWLGQPASGKTPFITIIQPMTPGDNRNRSGVSAISRIMSTLELGLVDAIGVPKRHKDWVSAIGIAALVQQRSWSCGKCGSRTRM
jgi:hypothetical protein